MRRSIAVIAGAASLCALAALAQQGTQNSGAARSARRGQTYASLASLPDWSGAYSGYNMAHGVMRSPEEDTVVPPLKRPADLAKFQAAQRMLAAGGDNTELAIARQAVVAPGGRGGLSPAPVSDVAVAAAGGGRGGGFNGTVGLGPTGHLEFLFTPGRVTLITSGGVTRRIYTDGTVADPTFISAQGTSTGYWDGDTLVVDTIGLNPKTTLLGVTQAGDGFKIHERMFMKAKPGKKSADLARCPMCDGGVFEIDTTIEAPEALTVPFKMLPQLYAHMPYKHELLQDYLGETTTFDRSVDLKNRQQTFDLTPPADLPPPPAN